MPTSRKRKKAPQPSRAFKLASPEELLKKQLKAFRKKFGRDPRAGEPLFFDPDADEPRELDIQPAVLEAMEKAGTPAHIVFAYKRTGLLMTSDMEEYAPSENVEAWHDAIDLYHALEQVKGRSDLPNPREWKTDVADLILAFTQDDLMIVRKVLAAVTPVESKTKMTLVARLEIAAAFAATALDCAYDAAEATKPGTGAELFERAQRTILRRALEIYGQRGAGEG